MRQVMQKVYDCYVNSPRQFARDVLEKLVGIVNSVLCERGYEKLRFNAVDEKARQAMRRRFERVAENY